MKKLTENDLVIPVLEFLKANGGVATIRQIRDYILNNYPLSDADLKMSVTRRNEHVFEQQIRNLTSHNKLEKLGLAEVIEGGFRLLPEIKELLDNSSQWVYDLISKSKNNSSVKRVIDGVDKHRQIVAFDESVAAEGLVTTAREVRRRTRSAKLRKAAIDRYSVDGHICCACCGMDFSVKYGPEFADSCIEIHHRKPIFMYDGDDVNRSISEALKNVIPVCPNCHRVIHRHKLFSDNGIQRLKRVISRNKA